VEDPIEPMVIRYLSNPAYGFLNVKIASSDLPATLGRIEAAWKKLDNIHPMNAEFYDDQIEKAYSQFAVMIKVIGFLGFLAVCIASMGLFGMVVFTTETKIREICIRKLLGASEGGLIMLLSRGFFVLLSVAALVAVPVTYLFFDKVILSNFVYHEPIGWTELLVGATGVMIMAGIMIAWQTWSITRTNPSEVLKNE
jgi:putative ABC transport system permease protein